MLKSFFDNQDFIKFVIISYLKDPTAAREFAILVDDKRPLHEQTITVNYFYSLTDKIMIAGKPKTINLINSQFFVSVRQQIIGFTLFVRVDNKKISFSAIKLIEKLTNPNGLPIMPEIIIGEE